MREILFRGKRTDNGEWVYGHFFDDIGAFIKERSSSVSTNTHLIDPSTVCQYTGLTDKNGKRIFEGDICRFKEWQHGEFCWVGVVKFEHCQFLIAGGPNKECETLFTLCLSRFSSEQIEIIGNVHDNPELLGGGGANG